MISMINTSSLAGALILTIVGPMLLTNASVLAQDAQPISSSAAISSERTGGQQTPAGNESSSDLSVQNKYTLGSLIEEPARLEPKGITIDFYYVADALANPYGGREDTSLWGRIRGSADVDFSKFTSWRGLTFHITGVWQYGTNLDSQYINTLVKPSSMSSNHSFRLDSYWAQQYLFHHKVAVRLGQIAAWDSYGNSEYGESFVNLSLGYAFSNLNQAVTFAFSPAGVPSFELKALPTDHLYLKAMVQSEERNPYSVDPNGLAFHLGGPVVATEIGYLKDPPEAPGQTGTMGSEPFITERDSGNYPGVYKFGAGYDPHNFFDPLTRVTSPGNYLVYGQVAQAVYRMSNVGPERNRGLDMIYGEDWSPGDVTQFNHQIMTGGRWTGVFGGTRSRDTLGLGYVWTSVGSHYRESQTLAGAGNLTHENLVELNYMMNVTRSLMLQPVFEWYVLPGGDASRGVVFVAGFRTKFTF
jgi:carbohydrate-selective porin OprB